MSILTGEQLRAARALARMSQAELADLAGLSLETIKRLERIRGPASASRRTVAGLQAAFRTVGVVFDVAGGLGRIVPEGAPAAAGDSQDAAETYRLIYHSVMAAPSAAEPRPALQAILEASQRNNRRLGLTGALLAMSGRFLQLLEGPREGLAEVFRKIRDDARHDELVVIDERRVNGRQFRDWAMCCGQLRLDEPPLSNEPALRDGLRPELLSPAGALGLLCVVRDIQPRASHR